MPGRGYNYIELTSALLAAFLLLHVPLSEMRVSEEYTNKPHQEEHHETPKPEPMVTSRASGHQCFHSTRENCPKGPVKCARIDEDSVVCCDVDSFRLKEGLAVAGKQHSINLHVLNATLDELDLSQSAFRRLASMAVTDGNIGNIVGQFLKHAPIACLNISNNNLTSNKLRSSSRPFANLFNLTVLDVSANNLTDFPLRLIHVTRKIAIDLSGNDNILCKEFQKAMESNNSQLITFLNYNKTHCALDLKFNWFKDYQQVLIDHVRVQKELNVSCRQIRPSNINCSCKGERLDLVGEAVTNMVSVECTNLHLKELPTNLPPNTIKLNVSCNNITSLAPVSDDPTYEHVRQLIIDNNNVQSLIELEGTKFIDNFVVFSIQANKLKSIHTYILSNTFDYGANRLFFISGNQIHCDCNTEKVLKVWLLENMKNIPDYAHLMCQDGMGPVINLVESKLCQQQRDWTDYIYYIIGAEVSILIILISKVSYDYWIFKTAGYLPWPANKMPRLPCDWLCE